MNILFSGRDGLFDACGLASSTEKTDVFREALPPTEPKQDGLSPSPARNFLSMPAIKNCVFLTKNNVNNSRKGQPVVHYFYYIKLYIFILHFLYYTSKISIELHENFSYSPKIVVFVNTAYLGT
jgi:hypothetical protein